jgi:spermidine synthase
LSDPLIIAHADTDIGTIYLSQREHQDETTCVHEIRIDGALLMSDVSPVSEQRLSTAGLARHPGKGPLRVLVGGLGLGYTAQAALADPRVSLVRVAEKMDFIIDWMARGLLPLSDEFATEERLEIVQTDVYRDLLGPPTETYDLILVDVDHEPNNPLSPDSEPFYTVEGQRCVARHLSPGGVLGVWSAFDDEPFARVLAAVYPSGDREEVTWPDDEAPDRTYCNMLFFARVPDAE